MLMLKRWLTYLSVLLLAALFYGIYDGYLSHYIFMVVSLLPIFSLLISLPHMLVTKAELSSVPPEIYVDEIFDVHVHIKSKGLSLPKVDIRYFADNITLPNDSVGKRNTRVSVYGCKDDKVPLPISSEHVGCVVINILSIKTYDFIGLFASSVKVPEIRRAFIMPRPIAPVPHPVFPRDKLGGKGLKPKPGGGFAEDYDLRGYRIGDPMNSIHWKLTSKMDKLIVREALVSEKGKIYICFNLFGQPDEIDSIFAQVAYISRYMIARMIEFCLCYYDSSGEAVIAPINEADDYLKVMSVVFQNRIPLTGKPIDKAMWGQADWFYVVRPFIEIGKEEEV